jgi:ion channel
VVLILEALAGLLIVLATLLDVFVAVVVPRRTPNTGRMLRLSAWLIPGLWSVWRELGLRMSSSQRREAFLGGFGSLAVVLLLLSWVAALIVGYGLLLFALGSQLRPEPDSLGTAIYFAGVALVTLGFGDIVATGGPARLITLVAATNGLGLFALVITLLFSLYGSLLHRERSVVVLQASAGAPPSGVTLLETYALAGIGDDLPPLFAHWQAWAAEVLESQLAYPILAYFRSSHADLSWISALGAVMDAATLVLTTIEDGPTGWATLSRATASHGVQDLVSSFQLRAESEVGVERAEFDEARRRLMRVGYVVRDADEAWASFSRERAEYAGRLNTLARHWATPPAPWIGDRSPLNERPGVRRPRDRAPGQLVKTATR